MHPDVSVILPMRNAAGTLGPCLESIGRQSCSEFEVIAVDDGSTDDSVRIGESFAGQDARFRLLAAGGVGLAAALNVGIRASRAPLVARMDADDIMHPQRLQIQRECMLADPGIDLVSCRVEIFPRDQLRNGYLEYERWQNSCVTEEEIAQNIYVESPFAHPSVMIRRSVYERFGGYRDGMFPEDYDLWLRMAAAGCRMAKVPEVLLRWRESPHRLSRTDARYSRESFDALRASYLALDPRIRKAGEIVIWGAGRCTRRRAKRLLDLGVRHSGWIDIDPRKIGKSIGGVPVHDSRWLEREPRPFVLVYVTNHGAREEIAVALRKMGYVPGMNYLCVG
jgi:glycosyltransferase involved in cell wall biosynthesis